MIGLEDSRGSTSITRDAAGRVAEVRRVARESTSIVTVTRDATGHPVRIVDEDRYEIAGVWDGERLLRTSTSRRHDGEVIGTSTLERTFDQQGRLSRSVVVEERPDAPDHRSEMQIMYVGCSDTVEIVLEPEHISLLEVPFELVQSR